MSFKPTAASLKAATFALAACWLLLAGCAGGPPPADEPLAPPAEAVEPAVAPAPAPEPARQPEVADVSERWGVQVIGLRTTSGGYMLDFRFRVLDAQKAAPLFVRQTKPYLLDVRTGAKFQVPNPPKTGPLRTSDPPKQGIVYWMFFANPGQYLKPGNLATVVIGDFQAPNLVVE